MCFTLMELAKNSDIQEKVRNEIREKIGSDPITYESISKMNYLEQVLDETMRLYAPAPLIDRVALNDYKVSFVIANANLYSASIFHSC